MKTGDEKRLNKRLLLGEHQPATKALMQELFDSLEVEGLVRKTGLYDWGEIILHAEFTPLRPID